MNTKTKTGAFLLGLSLSVAYVLGCATARVAPTVSAQPAAPGGRWAYHCVDGYNAETIMREANGLGAQGWEMVGGLGSERVRGLWCFKRPY